MTVKALYVLTTIKRSQVEIDTLKHRGELDKAQNAVAARMDADMQALDAALADGFSILHSGTVETTRYDSVLFMLHKPDPVPAVAKRSARSKTAVGKAVQS